MRGASRLPSLGIRLAARPGRAGACPSRGFTLVELMVVVAIVGILGAFMFSVATRPYGANAQTLADQMQASFGYARTRAISSRREHLVTIYSSGSTQYIATSVAPDKGMTYTGALTNYLPVETVRISSNAILWSAVAGVAGTGAAPTKGTGLPYYIRFKPDGSATASTIYLTDQDGSPKKYRVVLFNATGSSYARQTW